MSDENKSDHYEIGYGKPPKSTQFKKGASGNPSGRPRKAPDFDNELIRQSRAPMVVIENGRRRRMSKHTALHMQLLAKGISGNTHAARTYLDRLQQALERAAVKEEQRARDLERWNDVSQLSHKELEEFILASQEFQDWKDGKWDFLKNKE